MKNDGQVDIWGDSRFQVHALFEPHFWLQYAALRATLKDVCSTLGSRTDRKFRTLDAARHQIYIYTKRRIRI